MTSQDLLCELEGVFKQLMRKMTAEWNKQLEQGLSASQSMILDILDTNGPQKVSDLAERMEITLSAITSLSDKLICAGFAKRERASDDRRIVLLSITPSGEEVLQAVQEQRRLIVKKFYRGLSDEDISDLIRIYSQVLHNIDSQNGVQDK